MIVKYRKAFFNDIAKIKNLKQIEEIEFITEIANRCATPDEIPGFKPLRQYPGMGPGLKLLPFGWVLRLLGIQLFLNV